MKRKILWCGLSFLLVAALVLASCAEAVPGEQEEEEEEVVVPVGEEPQYGGTLTIHRTSWEPSTADIIAGMWGTNIYTGPIVDELLMGDFEKYGPRGTDEFGFQTILLDFMPLKFIRGQLAESWELSSERIVFHLRPGIYWAAENVDFMESRELIADDVVFALTRTNEECLWLKGTAWARDDGFMERIYAEDKYTVVVEIPKFDFAWPKWLSTAATGIYAPEAIAAGAGDWDNVVGTGPFMFKEFVTGSHIAYLRNPNFWWKATIDGVEYETPFVDELVYTFIADESTRVAALRTGKLDIYHGMSVKHEETLADTNPELLKVNWLHLWASALGLRTDMEPLNNKEVRRALMIAMDLPAMSKALFFKGESYTYPTRQGMEGYTPLEELPPSTRELYSYDPDLARQMLADEGYPEGFTVTAIAEGEAEALVMAKSYWEAIDVTLEITTLESVAYTAARFAGEYQVVEHGTENFNVRANFERFLSVYIPPESTLNASFYTNPYIDEGYARGSAIVDAVERAAVWKELYLIVQDDVAMIPYGSPYVMTYWWPWAKNYYGEKWDSGADSSPYVDAATWIDQDLKAEMGY